MKESIMKHAVLFAVLALATACGRDERPAPIDPQPGVETPEPACSEPGRRDDAGRPIPQC